MVNLWRMDGGESFQLEPGSTTTLGRCQSNTIAVNDPRASRYHAEIRQTGVGCYMVSDLKSRNGTYVSGRRVTEAVLKVGDEIRIGRTRFVFQTGQPFQSEPSVAGAQAPLAVRSTEPPALESPRRDSVIVTDTGQTRAGTWFAVDEEPQFPPPHQVTERHDLLAEYKRLRAAHELSRAIGTETDLKRLLERILDKACELLSAQRGVVLLVDPDTHAPIMRVARRDPGSTTPIRLSRTILDEVIVRRRAVVIGNAGVDSRFKRAASVVGAEFRSAMCVPMLHRDEVLGMIHVDSTLEVNLFERRDLEIFSSIASQAALAVKNLLLRQQLDALVAQQRRRLESLLRNLPDGLVLLDPQDTIVLANHRGEVLLGELGAGRPGQPLSHLGEQPLADLVARAGREGSVDVPTPQGQSRILALSARCIESGDALAGHTVLTLRDVTQAQAQERRLARSERLATLGEVAGGLVHDFNNLLTIILSSAAFISSESSDPKAREDGEQILDAARRAGDIARRLMRFSARETGQADVIDLSRSVETLEPLLRRSLGDHVRYESNLAESLARTRLDRDAAERVIMNLALNGRDAMPDGGHLTIETNNLSLGHEILFPSGPVPPGDYIQLVVLDTGCGIDAARLDHIFDPFFTTKKNGTGLGLAAVRDIVDKAGGHIQVSSELGIGTRFEVLFPPTADPSRAGGTSAHPAIRSTPSATVLLAEDEADLRGLLQRSLERAGHRVLTGPDMTSVLDLARRHLDELDLLVTDVIMPELCGPDLALELKRDRPALPVLFVSAYTGSGAHERIAEQQAPFLSKPFTPDELVERVRQLLQS